MQDEDLIKAVFERISGDDVRLLKVHLETDKPEIISFDFEVPKVGKSTTVGVDMSKGNRPPPVMAAIDAGEAAKDYAAWKIGEARDASR